MYGASTFMKTQSLARHTFPAFVWLREHALVDPWRSEVAHQSPRCFLGGVGHGEPVRGGEFAFDARKVVEFYFLATSGKPDPRGVKGKTQRVRDGRRTWHHVTIAKLLCDGPAHRRTHTKEHGLRISTVRHCFRVKEWQGHRRLT